MDDTANLNLPYIIGGQAQKHITHNEALGVLDAVVQLMVLDKDLATPPGAPANGARYIVASSPTGAWAGQSGKIAAFQEGAWAFYAPLEGWLAWAADEDALYVYTGTSWALFAGSSVNPVSLVGVNATATTGNRLSVSSPASLFNHEGAGHQLKINKSSATDTGSVLFQTGFSGRAEFGLAGDDDFHVKVSADGSTWREAVVVSRSTGAVAFPNTAMRERLTAARTYYVRTDGNDSNTGLANTSGGAFLTLQKAYDVIAANLDLAGFTVTVQIGDGTYTAGVVITQPWTGGGAVTYQGNNSTPANVLISITSASCFRNNVALPGILTIKDMKLATTTSGLCIYNHGGGILNYQNIDFGACAQSHVLADIPGAYIECTGNYSISGGAAAHWQAGGLANVVCQSKTITVSANVTFTSAFASANRNGLLRAASNTFSLGGFTVTGSRFTTASDAYIETQGGLTDLPGTTAGTVASNGRYNDFFYPVPVRKVSDESTSTDTVFTADAALSFSMLASTTYKIGGVVKFTTGASGDFKYQFTGPSSPTLVRISTRDIVGGGTAFAGVQVDTALSTSHSVAGAGTDGAIEFEALIQNGANAGTFAFEWAQNTSDGTSTTVRAGSMLEYTKVA